MTKLIENPFLRMIRNKYHRLGWRQFHLAERLGINAGSMSEYLNGKTRMPDAAMVAMCRILNLTDHERQRAQLAHDMLHTPNSVLHYLLDMEQDRLVRDLCNERLERLQSLTGELLERSRAASAWAPLLLRPDAPTRIIDTSIASDPDEESRDERPAR